MSYEHARSADVVDGRRALERGAHPVAVVLDEVDHRQLPERGHVQRLVEGAVVHRGVAEEADADLVAAAILDREGDAVAIGRWPPTMPCPPRKFTLRSKKCIEPPLPFEQPSDAAEQLRHHRRGCMPRASAWPCSR